MTAKNRARATNTQKERDQKVIQITMEILTLRAPAEAISVLGGPMAKYFGCQKDMVFRVDC